MRVMMGIKSTTQCGIPNSPLIKKEDKNGD